MLASLNHGPQAMWLRCEFLTCSSQSSSGEAGVGVRAKNGSRRRVHRTQSGKRTHTGTAPLCTRAYLERARERGVRRAPTGWQQRAHFPPLSRFSSVARSLRLASRPRSSCVPPSLSLCVLLSPISFEFINRAAPADAPVGVRLLVLSAPARLAGRQSGSLLRG